MRGNGVIMTESIVEKVVSNPINQEISDKLFENDRRFDLVFNNASSKPKLLYVVEAMGGGVFTYIVELVNSLVNDFDIYIAYGIRNQTPDNYKEYFDSRVKMIFIKNFTRSINLNKDIQSYFEIREIAKQIKPDIVHLHSSKAGVIGRFLFNFSDIPVFYTPHGYSFLMQDRSKVKCFIYKTIERFCAKCNCTTVSCSYGEYEETLKLTKRAVDIDNGIDINGFNELVSQAKNISSFESHDKQLKVFTLGRVNYQKNPELFNEIATRLPDVKFVWIGDGPLINLLTAPNIEVTGWKNREEALAISMSCDIFILTSLWEGLPLSLLEAMYMKKPVVVSNVIGNRDVVKNKENGYVCDKVEDYVSAISDVAHHKEYARNAYYDVIGHYNIVNMTQKYISLYKEALKSGEKVFIKKVEKYNQLVKCS
ncbi:glycosyltransferase [Butyrivibrio fibrisolvens]|uniref:glycosyltransferase n=1 Tax=Butyrivibrio fibrisolvens TaxID=831 RepID=UPI0020C16010|nr:glycosyltransferase [Butyrivibrio fibrisolvens]